jgi:hypothetical protein
VSDPYAPVLGDPSWLLEEPDINVDVAVKANVTEPTGSSGVQNVTLWFKNETVDWTIVSMTFADGTWTAMLSNQSAKSIDFKIKAFDYAGNSAETKMYQLQVKVLTGVPLFLVLLMIILAALTGSAIYLLWRRRHKEKAVGGAPEPALPSPPSVAAKPVAKPAALIWGYEMVSFVVPARNEGSTISQRIASVYERAVNHVGPSEIIVVDDGSVDDTYEAAWSAIDSNRRKWPHIPAKVVKLSSPIGKEEAIRLGRSKATGEIVETVNGETSRFQV